MIFIESDIHYTPGESQSFRPEGGGGMHEVNHFVDRADEFIKLLFGYDQRWSNFENHKVVPADLSQDAVVAKEPHHQHLTEHGCVNALEGLKRHAQLDLL